MLITGLCAWDPVWTRLRRPLILVKLVVTVNMTDPLEEADWKGMLMRQDLRT